MFELVLAVSVARSVVHSFINLGIIHLVYTATAICEDSPLAERAISGPLVRVLQPSC